MIYLKKKNFVQRKDQSLGRGINRNIQNSTCKKFGLTTGSYSSKSKSTSISHIKLWRYITTDEIIKKKHRGGKDIIVEFFHLQVIFWQISTGNSNS
jgi:hypothetical protein